MNKGSFKDYHLSDEIVKALDSLEYENPTEVQSKGDSSCIREE